jgi:hypothetical protein
MNEHRDPDRLIQAFVMEGQTELADQVYDVVRASIEHKRQRVVIGPWRLPTMNKLVPIGLGAAAVVLAVVVGTQLFGAPASSGVGGAPSVEPSATPSPTPVGGKVDYQLDGAPATTEVDVVADGANVSGTAVTTFARGTHTVQLECADRDGDTWVLAGTTEQTTVPDEKAGDWSVVLVRDGSPQLVGIWFSADPSYGSDCDGWLAASDFSTIDLGEFAPVESGALVPPPDLAP